MFQTMFRNPFSAAALAACAGLAGCTDPGARHRAEVFSVGGANQRQELKTVIIMDVQAAKIEVSDTRNQDIAKSIGTAVGAIVGAGLGEDIDRGSQSAVLGGVVGAEAGKVLKGKTALVDGVQIIYREGTRLLASAQVARPCDYAPGPALVTVTKANETRIRSNHDCIKGRENEVGQVSKLDGLGEVVALDQDTLDDLERQRVRLEKQLEVDWARVIDEEDDDEEEAQ